jgi:hypothetical protein
MSDEEFLKRFETLALPDDGFHPRDHGKLTWIYLRRFPMLEVLARLSAGLAALAAARGKPERYHETITWAFIFLVRERVARIKPGHSWEEFAAEHPDLLDWKNSVLRTYYRDETVGSDLARKAFLLPDLLLTRVRSE